MAKLFSIFFHLQQWKFAWDSMKMCQIKWIIVPNTNKTFVKTAKDLYNFDKVAKFCQIGSHGLSGSRRQASFNFRRWQDNYFFCHDLKMKCTKRRNISTAEKRIHFSRKPYEKEALVWWLWETTHVQEVVGSNPGTVYWMVMTFFTLMCRKNCIVCLKRPKINVKEAGVGLFKNYSKLNHGQSYLYKLCDHTYNSRVVY